MDLGAVIPYSSVPPTTHPQTCIFLINLVTLSAIGNSGALLFQPLFPHHPGILVQGRLSLSYVGGEECHPGGSGQRPPVVEWRR